MIACKITMKAIGKILDETGLSPNSIIHKKLDSEVELRCRPYVPRREGYLERSGRASYPSVGFVKWGMPYARYQYYGYLMVGKNSKILTAVPLKSHGGGLRGSRWFERMKVDCCKSIVQTLARMVGGKAK